MADRLEPGELLEQITEAAMVELQDHLRSRGIKLSARDRRWARHGALEGAAMAIRWAGTMAAAKRRTQETGDGG
jgi:predicted mannosyl-3-phosphoglycerate phosphatase (HAD superfamily)